MLSVLWPRAQSHPPPVEEAMRKEANDELEAGDAIRQPRRGITNQHVLMVTCTFFFLFVIGAVIGAVVGHSRSLLGDAAAMSVDVCTYFSNMVAEHIKVKSGGAPLSERTRLILEVAIPTFSVCALLGVTTYVTVGAVQDIITPPVGGDDVNINIMYGFASVNALVDVISAYMFYHKGRDVFFATEQLPSQFGEGPHISHVSVKHDDDNREPFELAAGPDREKNLNMISAFTHVGGDTLRTASIFIAAIVATVTDTPDYLCDAWAAAIVTITIVVMVIPLIHEICQAYFRNR